MPSPEIFTNIINAYLPEPDSSLVNGIIFGINLNHKTAFYDDIKRVGLLHIVVLSGMNISLMSGILSGIIYRFGKTVSILLNILTIIIFVAFVGIQAPILRAAIMAILTSVGLLLGRRTIAIYLLFISAIVMILINPEWLTSISFQLSFGATFGIILFSKTSKNETFFDYCKTDLRTSLAAQVFTVPIIFMSFRQISFISPIANLLVAWTIAPIMIFGFLAAFLGKIHYVLGVFPAYVTFGLTHYLVVVIEVLARVPFAFVQF